MPSIVFSQVSFSWRDEHPLFTALSFTAGPGRTGLVAPNGAGKSTVLRLAAGELVPAAGSVSTDGTVGYLSQTLPLLDDRTHRTVADLIGIAGVLAALEALTGGDSRDEVFAAIGDDWDVEE